MGKHEPFAYRHHKAKGLAYVRLPSKQRLYLGRWDSPESHARHRAVVAELRAGREVRSGLRCMDLSVGELAERYVVAMEAEHGPKAWQAVEARLLALDLCRQHAGLPLADFGPTALVSIRTGLLELPDRRRDRRRNPEDLPRRDLSRRGINRRVRRIIGIFRWGVERELVRAEQWQALTAVRPLRAGVGFDHPPREPADPAAVDSVVAYLTARGATGAARCVRFLRATGCRPGEAFIATAADLRLNASPPLYLPRHHKCASRGMDRVVVLNAAALAVVHEALADCPRLDAPLFLNRAGQQWEDTELLHMVERACKALGEKRWVPYQLRHLAATEAVNRTGSEAAAAAMLGHAPDSTIIRRYSRQRLLLAAQAAEAVGA
jgi:integrase